MKPLDRLTFDWSGAKPSWPWQRARRAALKQLYRMAQRGSEWARGVLSAPPSQARNPFLRHQLFDARCEVRMLPSARGHDPGDEDRQR